MKKILILLFAITLVLTGCGKKEDVIASKTCHLEENGTDMLIEMKAKNDIINRLDLTYTITAKSIGLESFDQLDEKTKNEVKEGFVKELGLEKSSYEGIQTSIEIDKDMVFKLTADLDKADKEVLSNLGYDFDSLDKSLERGIKDLEEDGFTCK